MILKTKINRLQAVGLTAVLTMVSPAVAVTQATTTSPVPSQYDTLSLTLIQAQLYALAHNPRLLASRRLREAARGRLRQAGVYRFNPEVSIESEQVGRGRTLDAYEGELSQEIEWAGQRGLRKKTAQHDLARTDATIQDVERVTRAAAAKAFYKALAADNRVTLAEKIRVLNEQLEIAVSELLEAGSISVLEANLARIESGRAQTRVLEERRNANTTLLDLRRTLGMPDTQPLRLSSDVPTPPRPSELDPDSLVRVAMARRPDLSAATSRIDVGQSRVRLARRERLPNVRLALPFDRLDGAGSEQIGVGVGMSIPLWNRNQGTVAELKANVDRNRSELDAVVLSVHTEVLDTYQRYLSATEEEAISAATVLEPARFNQTLLDDAFRSGKIDLPTLLLIRNQLLEAELDYWESWLELRFELVRLTSVLAEPMPIQ